MSPFAAGESDWCNPENDRTNVVHLVVRAAALCRFLFKNMIDYKVLQVYCVAGTAVA
ncbi:MAG: hypothetical protein Q8K57_07490 [Thiobacillus sp.]|nr:hypothetical protein [Gammaproteobacteria bacterium]MDP1924610.1 hypothetical protein [Thiobacillus sp.]